MTFEELHLAGAYRIQAKVNSDARGGFSRLFCRDAFARLGLVTEYTQTSLSTNIAAHTLRGLHYQATPREETKLVSCLRGRVFDAIVDIRRESPTFGQWHGQELCAGDGLVLYVPAGFAHGFLTLEAGSEVLYQISVPYHSQSARGLTWNDPEVGISWPAAPQIISDRDRALPPLAVLREEHE